MKNFAELLARAKKLPPNSMAVAQAADGLILQAVEAARREGLIKPILVGQPEAIRQAAAASGLDLDHHTIIPADKQEAAAVAVRLVAEGEAELLMKGYLPTGELLKEVLNKENGLNSGTYLSQVAVFELPNFNRLLMATDAGLNIAPGLKQKIDIVQNAIDLARCLGIKNPIAALLCAVETVNPAMPATLEAASLAKLAERGGIKGGRVEGPLALDNAISVEAARHKGINTPLAGKADILVAHDIEAGNILYKALVFFGKAVPASLVVGARIPVVVTSRSDTPTTNLYSIALGVLYRPMMA